PTWNGLRDTEVVVDAAIDGLATHRYKVTVALSVGSKTTSEGADCVLTDSETGTGLLNTVALTSNGLTSHADACRAPGIPPDQQVPKTGTDTLQPLAAGLVLMVAGGFLLHASRRRRRVAT
ncbi:MAG TPA: LPXTG cell wall anchor domain-containing protein, partial [Ilumatobacteraceae bacterium]|nr:LPXTG cell wall anchor domain-containing protein [Ilumatobacteraceae bacterium]